MMKRILIAALASAALSGAAFAQGSTVLGPITTTVSVATTAIMAALPANPTRKGVTICNGSATLFITFTTGSVTPVNLTTGQVLPTGTVATSCYTIGTTGVSATGGVGAQINVVGSGAGPTNVTFFEYF
jgi:hypothetical protein